MSSKSALSYKSTKEASSASPAGDDANKAWDEVYRANMAKEVGIKEGRPNPLGLPDLMKPDDWQGPVHEDNCGNISDSFQ